MDALPKRAADAPQTGPVDVAAVKAPSLVDVLWKRAAEVTGTLAALLLVAAVIPW